MKRHGHLFPQLSAFSHLLAAYRRALRGSGRSREALRFTYELEPRLLALQTALQTGSYQPQPYRYFEIRDPKHRLISVAPFADRIVHHAVVGLLEPIYEPSFIYDSYATRKGKGQHAAILRAQYFLRRERWFFKADIEQYFASIDHERLIALLARKVKDRAFLSLTERIIRNGGTNGKGLPIGNLTSQFFANVYLNPFDHWIKQDLRVKGYVRYMDDFVLFASDCDTAKRYRQAIANWLADHLDLRLKPQATFLNQRAYGLSFLGARIYPRLIRPHPVHLRRNLGHLRRQQRAWLAGELEEADFVTSLACRWAHLNWYDQPERLRQLRRQMGL